MGMDVYGLNPSNASGEYFRANVWRWRPLAEMCIYFAPQICKKCAGWYVNDGQGLDAEDASELAAILERDIEQGLVGGYIERRQQALDKLPEQACEFCNGTGIRTDEVGVSAGFPTAVLHADRLAFGRFADNPEAHPRFGQVGYCNGCTGAGTNPDPRTLYTLDMDKVQAWVAFLKYCGGFKIC